MRHFLALCFSCIVWSCFGQATQQDTSLRSKLTLTNSVPAELLAKRSAVFYSVDYSPKQLEDIQKMFQQTGIDAIGYFKTDLVFAGRDVTREVADYLTKREITFLVLLDKIEKNFSITITPFNETTSFVDSNQNGWDVSSPNLTEALQLIYRTAVNNQPRKNLLVNDYPESDFPLQIIEGRRSDFFAIDLKVDNLAVPWFGEAEKDSTLVKFFKEVYPFKYGMSEAGLDKTALRRKGFHYLLCYVHTRGSIAKELLGYPPSGENAITSVTFPNGELQLKTIPSEIFVYKFYLKHIESGNVFLGTKWDADIRWEDALRNHIKGFKAELKIP